MAYEIETRATSTARASVTEMKKEDAFTLLSRCSLISFSQLLLIIFSIHSHNYSLYVLHTGVSPENFFFPVSRAISNLSLSFALSLSLFHSHSLFLSHFLSLVTFIWHLLSRNHLSWHFHILRTRKWSLRA